jgi:CelD/BcsL family acetyltransferase involved in cellulose biosynthesis
MNSLLQLADKDITSDEQYSSVTIDILTGEQVLDLILDKEFLLKWRNLYIACPWGSVFQSQEFVCPWYRLYHSAFIPVVVKAEANGRLIGLLTLTIEEEKRVIMAAGLGAAEYQTWLALPVCGERFITEALNKLQKLFIGYEINLYNVPPSTPLGWTTSDSYWRKRCLTKPLRRPLMDLRDPEVSKLFRKKQFREKTNRLRRLGNLSFEKITDTARFETILDELAAQSDFRKGAKFDHSEFADGPARRQFLLELFDQGILHTTILKLDDDIIASIAACSGRGYVHLAGVNTHSPTLSRYSPGTINFVMLGQLLMEEGIDIFDLTPGGDAYKERLATSHDFVHDIYIGSKLKTLVNRNVMWPFANLIKSKLKNYQLTPLMLKFALTKIRQRATLAKKTNPLNLCSWHYLKKGFSKHQAIVKCFPVQNEVKAATLRVNSLQDLLQYDQQNGSVIRWDFLEDAMRRFEEGGNIYSLSENGKLIFCAWHNIQPTNHIPTSSVPSDAVFLEGIYCYAGATDRLASLLNIAAREIQPDCKAIYCLIDQKYKEVLA